MHTIEIPSIKFKKILPENLSECTDYEYIEICELMFLYQSNKISFREFKVHALYKLLKMKPSKNTSEEKDVNIYLLSELFESFFYSNENQKIIKLEFIDNKVPIIRTTFNKLYGPKDAFENINFGQYLDALRLFNDFNATQDISILYELAATFYFYKKEIYDSLKINKRAKIFKQFQIGFIYGVYLWFASFNKYLSEAKLIYSGKEIDLSIIFETGNSSDFSTIPSIGLDSVAFTLAESGTFGDLEKLRLTNFWQIIIRMYDLRKQALDREEQEKQLPNATH